MRFGLLGATEVRADDGTPVVIAAPKRRALLAILLLDADRPVSVDRLAEALWGSDLPPTAVPSLHAHVSRLRGEIGPDRILTAPAGYRIRVEPEELDLQVFQSLLADGRRAADEGRWAVAADGLRSALEMWRGPALTEFADADFAQGAIARLEELRSSAIEVRIDAEIALGRHAEIVAELEALVSAHPLRERLWCQLMLALYRSGRQADALSAYRRLRSALVTDLGIDPAPAAQELEVRILRQDPTLAGPSAGPTQPAVRLPLPLTPLVGRRPEFEEALGALRSHRLLTLTGPGGVGKTRLGILVAHALLGDHPDGVLFVDLSSVRDPALVLESIGAVTGGGERPADVIGDRRMLIVLDNLEQVIDAATDVQALLDQCPAVRILVTSRTPLRLRGEWRLEVPPLAGPDAAALFDERARAAIRTARLDAVVVDEIVAKLDGLPLAIELAASRLGVLSPESLRDRLAERLPLLTAGARDAPERHRTLRETIAWSYDLLDPAARAAFRKLSVLAGGFDLAAAFTVAEADIDGLSELVDHSLLRRQGSRYGMLETIREFATEQADAHGESGSARDRHLAHFVAIATSTHRSTTDGGPMGRNAWITMCGTERENLRLAFEWAVTRDDSEAIVRLFRSIGMYWMFVGAIDEGVRWGETAVQAASRLGRVDAQLSALVILSEFLRHSGESDRAIELKTDVLGLARAIGDHVMIAVTLGDIASIHATRGEFALAHALLAEAQDVHDRERSTGVLARVHTITTMAEVALMEGDVAGAERHVAEATDLESGADLAPDWIVESMSLTAKTLHAGGHDVEAESLFRAVVGDAAEIGMRIPLVDSLEVLSAIVSAREPEEAARLLGMADRLRAESRVGVWDPAERERTIEVVRKVVGDAAFARCLAEGRAMSIPAIVEAVLRSAKEGAGP